MNSKQAKLFWKSLTMEQKIEFNNMMNKLENKELMLTYVGVDDNEQIQRIVLENKDVQGKPSEPFYKHFSYDN